jgi:hypothetical protein
MDFSQSRINHVLFEAARIEEGAFTGESANLRFRAGLSFDLGEAEKWKIAHPCA